MSESVSKKKVIIAGAGPAGLTAGYELIKKGQYDVIIVEKLDIPGGLSRTVNYKGNRIDIGGHRFFSKSEKVLNWWLNILPLEDSAEKEILLKYQNKSKNLSAQKKTITEMPDERMLVRTRHSRIYFLKQLFPYPITLSFETLKKLGFKRSIKIFGSYFFSLVFPVKPEHSLKDFLINRFGRELYMTFFEDYTRKVWGVDPDNIPAEWGKQRIKGISVRTVISHALKNKRDKSIKQADTETSLIEKFLYPRFGPGQLWEKVAKEICSNGGNILYNSEVTRIAQNNCSIKTITVESLSNGESQVLKGDIFISTLPMQHLFNSLIPAPPKHLLDIANGLEYREFISVGLLVKELKLVQKDGTLIKDNWIYIQEKNVKIGRLQLFNNWSPYMVNDPSTIWLGLEYFCKEGDELWMMQENELLKFAEEELIKIGIIQKDSVLDGTVIKVEKAYPGYFGSYKKIDELKDYINNFENLFLAGRNGMHRYNNQDHSMLTAMEIVDQIVRGKNDKALIWAINTEKEYHEDALKQPQ